MVYVVEYKQMVMPYSYRFLKGTGDNFARFESIVSARKECIRLIRRGDAVLAFVRPVDQGVYRVRGTDGFVLEDRPKHKWYHLNKDGTLGRPIKNIRTVPIVQSAY